MLCHGSLLIMGSLSVPAVEGFSMSIQGAEIACAVQWGVFVLFACCVFLMTLSVYLFFPETKGVPIEDCPYVFKHHWYWKK